MQVAYTIMSIFLRSWTTWMDVHNTNYKEMQDSRCMRPRKSGYKDVPEKIDMPRPQNGAVTLPIVGIISKENKDSWSPWHCVDSGNLQNDQRGKPSWRKIEKCHGLYRVALSGALNLGRAGGFVAVPNSASGSSSSQKHEALHRYPSVLIRDPRVEVRFLWGRCWFYG